MQFGFFPLSFFSLGVLSAEAFVCWGFVHSGFCLLGIFFEGFLSLLYPL